MGKRPSSLPLVGRAAEAVRASYRRKLAAGLLVVLLIAAVAAVGLYVQLGAVIGGSVEQSMTAAADAEADELTEWTSQNRLVARVMAAAPADDMANETAVRDALRTQEAALQEADLVSAYVIDRRNLTVEISTRRSLEGTPVEALPWEEEFAFRDFADVRITRPHDTGAGTTGVAFITPIRQAPGHLLVVTIDAASVFDRFEHPVDGGFTRVVDSNGTVVFADDPAATLQQYRPALLRPPAVSRALDGQSGFIEDPDYQREEGDSTEYVAAYAPVPGTDWVVIEHAPAVQAYAVLREARTWIGVVGLVAFVGLLGVVAVLTADVTGALSRLSDRAERIADGEYDVTFETERPDEFGDLNRTLASTRDTLRERISEVRETADALEATNTALEERSTMVRVLNRILRHNVRNDVNVIAGRAEYLARQTDDEQLQSELAAIEETALELALISDRTQRVKRLLAEEGTDHSVVRLPADLGGPLDRVRADAPEATVSLTSTGEDAVVTGASVFPIVLADVVERIVAHNGGRVAVDVSVAHDPADGSVTVTVADDGDGLPELDVEAVGEGDETPLRHAEGLALWVLEWTVNKADGRLVVDCPEATVDIWLPTTPVDD